MIETGLEQTRRACQVYRDNPPRQIDGKAIGEVASVEGILVMMRSVGFKTDRDPRIPVMTLGILMGLKDLAPWSSLGKLYTTALRRSQIKELSNHSRIRTR